MDPEPAPGRPRGARGLGVVVVPGVVGIDREGGQGREVDARVRREGVVRGGLGLGGRGAGVGAAQAAVEHGPSSTSRATSERPRPADSPRAALAGADQHEVALAAPPRSTAVRGPAEQRLGDEKAAALLEHRDERLVEARRRAAADGRAHRLSAGRRAPREAPRRGWCADCRAPSPAA